MAGSDSLNGKAISDTYKDLLQVPNANSGVDGTLRTVMDGEGTESTLQVSTAGVKSTGTLESTGNLTVGGTLTLGGTAISSLEDGATANDTDANLKNRANHTGTQAASTISDFDDEVANNTAVAANTAKNTNVPISGDATWNAKGDIAVATANDTAQVLTVGTTNDHVLTVDSTTATGVKWAAQTDTTYSVVDSSADGLAPQLPSSHGGKFLKADGTWEVPPDTGEANQNAFSTVAVSGEDDVAASASTDTLNLAAGSNVTITTDAASDTVTITATDSDTTYSDFTGATSGADGTAGLVPQPGSGDEGKYLKGDGTWDTVSGTGGGISNVSEDTTPQLGGNLDVNGQAIVSTSNADIEIAPNGTGATVFKGDTNAGKITLKCENNTHGVSLSSPAHDDYTGNFTLTLPTSVGTSGQVLSTDGTSGTAELSWVDNPDTTYSNFVGDDGSEGGTGTAGLVPAPADGTAAAGKYLKADGTWATPPDTTYSDFGGADGSSAGSAGLVPQPGASDNVNYLKGDGTWAAAATVTSIGSTANGGLKTNIAAGAAITASGTLGMDANSLSSDTYTASGLSHSPDSSGWSAGDEIVVVDSGSTDNDTKKIKMPCEIGIACSDESTALSTGDVASVLIPRAMTVTEVKASLTTEDSSDAVEVDFYYSSTTPGSSNGSAMLTYTYLNVSSGSYMQSETGIFDDGSGSATDTYSLAEDSFVTVKVESAGTEARGLKVWLLGYWS